jgi:hypothetical protein
MFTHEYVSEHPSAEKIAFGPTVEVRLRSLSLEVDALYRSKLDTTFPPQTYSSNSGSRTLAIDREGYSWEVPILVAWHRLPRLQNLFVGGGVSLRNVSSTEHLYGSITPLFSNIPIPFDTRSPIVGQQNYGAVITTGIDVRTGIFHMRPQVRYTRWSASPESFSVKADAIEIVMGISIGK